MKVKAIKMGFYGVGRRTRRIKVGDIFDLIQESDFSPRWMARVEKPEIFEPEGAHIVPKTMTPKPRGNPNFGKKRD